jgi:hypothetical protein
MTPHQKHPSGKSSDSEKQHNHMTEFSQEIDNEHKENHQAQENCLDDCKEHDLWVQIQKWSAHPAVGVISLDAGRYADETGSPSTKHVHWLRPYQRKRSQFR